jgi:predicted Zn-dependent peptidase
MELASDPPPRLPGSSERDKFLQQRLFEEISARDRLNRNTDERAESFISGIRDDLGYDPSFIDYFNQSKQRIIQLKAKIARAKLGDITAEELEETKNRVDSAIGLLNDQPESLQRQLGTIEQKTQILLTKTIPAAIQSYEREIILNRALQRRNQEAETPS